MTVLAGALALAGCAVALEVAGRLDPDAEPGTRVAGAVAVLVWAAIVLAEGLGSVGGFTQAVVVPLLAAGWWARRSLSISLPPLPGGPERVALGIAVIGASVAVSRAWFAPPLGWDALTYHLVIAGRFVQHGGPSPLGAPGLWESYDHFPIGGDLLWSWAMLVTRTASLVVPASVAVGLGVAILAGVLARVLGASERSAWAATAIALALPVTTVNLAAAYVDQALALCWVAASVLMVRCVRQPGLGRALLTCAALGAAAAIKVPAWPLVALAVPFLAWAFARSGPRLLFVAFISGAIVAVLPVSFHLARTWRATGNPAFPHTTPWGAGDPLLAAVMDGTLRGGPFSTVWESALLQVVSNGQHSNVGGALLVLLPLAVAGAWSRRSVGTAWVLSSGLLLFAPVCQPAVRELWTLWSADVARLFLPMVLALVALAVQRPVPGLMWPVVAAVAVVQGLPRSWSLVELLPVSAWLTSALLLAWAGARFGRRGALAVGALALFVTPYLGERVREPSWAAIKRGDMRLRAQLWAPAMAPDIWSHLDRADAATVAVVPPMPSSALMLYAFPLLGWDLRHDLVYVSPTTSGARPSLWPDADLGVDARAYIDRLGVRGVSLVVVQEPAAPEGALVRGSPCFAPILQEDDVSLWSFRCGNGALAATSRGSTH